MTFMNIFPNSDTENLHQFSQNKLVDFPDYSKAQKVNITGLWTLVPS